MTRSKKFILNTVISVINMIITTISGFILTRMMMSNYGSETNGLLSSISQFLGFISLAQMGVGAVTVSAWYKPLNDDNQNEISAIYKSAQSFFRKIALIFLVYTTLLVIFYPYFAKTNIDKHTIQGLIMVISFGLFIQYFWGITNSLLLQADQKVYISQVMSSIGTLINLIVSVFLICKGFNVFVVKMASIIVLIFSPIAMSIYVRKKYMIDRKVQYSKEPINNKWSGFYQHISAVIVDNTDVMVLTVFSSLSMVSVYQVYYSIIYAIRLILTSFTGGVQALFGSMIARNEKGLLSRTFYNIELIFGIVSTVLFSITNCSVLEFVKIYTNGVTDENYFVPAFAFILTVATLVFIHRVIYYTLIKAAGHFKETQKGAIIEAIINIAISIMLVISFGLVGVAIGTLCSMLYRTIDCAYYLSKNILCRDIKIFLKNFIVSILTFILCYICSVVFLKFDGNTYFLWIFYVLKVSMLCIIVTVLIYSCIYKKDMGDLIKGIFY